MRRIDYIKDVGKPHPFRPGRRYGGGCRSSAIVTVPENFNYSELMENELPEGWVDCSLGDVIKVSSGDGLTSSNMNKEGEIPVYGGNGITGFHDKSNIKEETIVIGHVGFYCGSVHLTPETAWVTDNALRVSFSHSNIDKRFLFWLLKSLNLGQYSGSSAQPVVSGTKLYQVPILLPPLAEQTRIMAKLDAGFGHLETLKTSMARIPELLKKFRQTVLTQAVTGKLTESWRTENFIVSGEIKRDYDLEFNVPESWQIDILQNMAQSHILGKMLDQNKNKGDDFLYLRNIGTEFVVYDRLSLSNGH